MRSVYTTGIIAAGYNNKTICACPVGFRRDFHCRITDSPSQNRSRFGHFFGNREAVRIRFYIIEGGAYSMASRKSLAGVSSLAKQQTGKGNYMNKLLLIALVVSGLDLVTRVTGTAITVIRVTDMGIIHMDTTDHIRTMVITAPRTGIGFIATTVIITTGIGTKLTLSVKPSIKSTELARKRF